MVKRLLIDATHNEEVRVAVVNTNSLEEFDSETANKRLTKSNIYLAKVIRVEPSLQAAFVEYNNGRHGFLPFAEIHPDYYRIPVADRKLLQESLALDEKVLNGELADDSDIDGTSSESESVGLNQTITDIIEDTAVENADELLADDKSDDEFDADDRQNQTIDLGGDYAIGADDLAEPEVIANNEKRNLRYRYKIQEVIKRRQIMLVQVVKEERGNKGAALTTYLSLPGRYCVLMPNAGHRAGGVSRKISDGDDRRRLRSLMKEFEIPEGMSLIVRTAGQERNKAEIRRDYEYLLRVWDDIREKTVISTAPELVYAEGDLVKRAIRDIYDRDIEEVLVEGEEAYKAAKNFMKSLIPSHAKKVKLYKDLLQPIFHRFNVEEQIEKMHQPVVNLPSGGSIVINHTEALVAIDVNSGKSTRERNIDDTAVKTNLEAAAEIGRQLRLRDIGGIIVVDFIDMHESTHIANVERKLRDALKSDRARIQVGRISQFGLLEFSRQRLRPSLLESHSQTCSHCHGTGLVRSVDSLALQTLREIERTIIAGNAYEILVTVPMGVDLFLLNQKRNAIVAIENRYGVIIQVIHNATMISPIFVVEVKSERPRVLKIKTEETLDQDQLQPSTDEDDSDDSIDDEDNADTPNDLSEKDEAPFVKKKSKRNNNRRRRNGRKTNPDAAVTVASSDDAPHDAPEADQPKPKIASPKATETETDQSENNPTDGQLDKRFNNNNNRRRRHPYQRRQHNKPFESNQGENGAGESRSNETSSDASSVVPIRGSSKQQAPRKQESQDSNDGRVASVDSAPGKKEGKKQSKGWLRRLLDS